jgi:hypothetical protein
MPFCICYSSPTQGDVAGSMEFGTESCILWKGTYGDIKHLCEAYCRLGATVAQGARAIAVSMREDKPNC